MRDACPQSNTGHAKRGIGHLKMSQHAFIILTLSANAAIAGDNEKSVSWLNGTNGAGELNQAAIDRWSQFAGRRMQVAIV